MSAPKRTRDIAVSFGAPMPSASDTAAVRQSVVRLSIDSWHAYAETLDPVHIHWLRTAKKLKGAVAIVDYDETELTHTRLLAATLAFSPRIGRATRGEAALGLLLPPGTGGVIATLAAFMNGRTVVPLNYTAGGDALRHAAEQAGIRTILTSEQFLKKLAARGIDIGSYFPQTRFLYLEHLRAGISRVALLRAVSAARLLPVWLLRALYFHRPDINDTAAVLFSSGSEGTPKGVELTHLNIMGNIKQIAGVLNPREDDVVLSPLPLFHAFGLTVSTLMPLAEGLRFVCRPDPTDAAAVGRTVARHRVTLLFGTSTFLGLYTRSPRVHPLMFRSLRLVVAGAEKLHEQVRTDFRQKFGHTVYEGYGTTETTPVASVNVPDVQTAGDWSVQIGARPGTVGMPLPGSAVRIVDPETLRELPTGEAGLVLIAGPQLMKGYLHAPEATTRALVELDGLRWYRTGDKGRLDSDGFLTILDRYSRFAKIGGEMVSLAAVEAAVVGALGTPDIEVAAVALPAPDKGEHIALLIAGADAEPAAVRTRLAAARVNPLMLPRFIIPVEELPRLGSGKTDFRRARQTALDFAAHRPEPVAV